MSEAARCIGVHSLDGAGDGAGIGITAMDTARLRIMDRPSKQETGPVRTASPNRAMTILLAALAEDARVAEAPRAGAERVDPAAGLAVAPGALAGDARAVASAAGDREAAASVEVVPAEAARRAAGEPVVGNSRISDTSIFAWMR